MYFEQRDRNGFTILECFGRFDEGDTNHFLKTVELLHGQGKLHIIINLSPIYFLDPKVVNLFTFAHEFLRSHHGRLYLVSPLSSVKNELIRSQITKTIPTFETIYDALHRPHSAYVEANPEFEESRN
ncbi:MAG: STAS domain-containing protein [Nitrospirales bacterium]